MTGKQDRFWPICTSLALHLLAAAVIFLGFAGPGLFSPEASKLNLVWVSMETKTGKVLISEAHQRQFKDSARKQDHVTPQGVATASTPQEDKKAGSAISYIPAASHTSQTTSRDGNTHTVAAYEKSSMAGTAIQSAAGPPAFTDAYPLYRENPRPDYPEIARMRGYEGIVMVTAEVLADGRVGKVRISRSCGYAILDESAMKTVKKWKYEPAKESGKPQKSWIEQPINFLLQDERYQS